nr:MAG TPA: hypothetical protein [Caudoviricetes sp.]
MQHNTSKLITYFIIIIIKRTLLPHISIYFYMVQTISSSKSWMSTTSTTNHL